MHHCTALFVCLFLGAATAIAQEQLEQKSVHVVESPRRSRVKRDSAGEQGEVSSNSRFLCEFSMGPQHKCVQLLTGCYCIIEDQRSWSQAVHYCQDNGKSLLSVDTVDVQMDLMTNLPLLLGPNSKLVQLGAWTSGSYFPTLGIFVWTSSLTPFYFNDFWRPGYPNNMGFNDCVRILPAQNAQWADLDCNQYLPFICESF